MIRCEDLADIFKKNNLTFFSGVPDSTFKEWMKFLDDGNGLTNILAVNECEAIAMVSGYYLATKNIGVVYMQNSGLGKTVNPLTSLCDKEVYSIPLILMIGLRGEPGEKDEPQHKKMGRITLPLLDVLEIPYAILPNTLEEISKVITEMKRASVEKNSPVAIIIKKGLLEEYTSKKTTKTYYEMSREDAIKTITNNIQNNGVIISTTGKASRELFEYRIQRKEKPKDFYTVGGMGCSASIANAIAMQKPNLPVWVFDGDGAVLMQMGTLATIGKYRTENLYHIVFDNNSYDSTGGQPTASSTVNFEKIALACGYKTARTIQKKSDLEEYLNIMKSQKGPQMLIIKIKRGARKDLGRPTTTPIENKIEFMDNL